MTDTFSRETDLKTTGQALPGYARLSVRLAGEKMNLGFLFPQTVGFFNGFRVEDDDSAPFLYLRPDELTGIAHLFPADATPEYMELMELLYHISSCYLPRGICGIHGAAIEWRGLAWLFVAPSGTGKSTQIRIWKELYGDEVTILNGDKPFLRRDGDTFTVCPSPWQGKEGWGCMREAPLGGIVFLEQALQNTIEVNALPHAGLKLFCQMLFRPITPDDVHHCADFVNAMASTVPVFYLKNLGDPDSVMLTRKAFETILNERGCDRI